MINALEGIPGSGKSYEATVYHVLEALKKGRLVVTNLPLQVEQFAAIDPRFVDLIELRSRPLPVRGSWDPNRVDDKGNGSAFLLQGDPVKPAESVPVFGHVWDYYHEWRHPDTGLGPLFVIDECHLALPPKGTPVEVIQWYKLHRHFNADVLLMTQSIRDMDGSIARLTAMLVRCRKADFLGKPDHYVRKVHAGYRGAVVSSEQRKYLPQFFQLYKSHTQGSSVAEASASDVSPFITKWRRFTFAWFLLGAIVVVWLLWPSADKRPKAPSKFSTGPQPVATGASFAAGGPPSGSVVVHSEETKTVEAKQLPVQEPDPDPYAQKSLHLKGSISKGERTVYLFVASHNGQAVEVLTDRDLVAAGYVFRPLAHCIGVLEWNRKPRAVTCDLPAQQIVKGT